MLRVVAEEIGRQELALALDEICRRGAERMLGVALEAEVDTYLETHRQQRDERGRALVVRNGHARSRTVVAGAGAIEVIAETGVRHVFAFGAQWFRVLDALGLRREVTLGRGGEPYPTKVASRTVAVYRGNGDFLVVAEKHAGSAGPPSAPETDILREALTTRGLA